jgi:hypothetical protein
MNPADGEATKIERQLERARAGAILPRSDWGRPSLSGRWDEGEVAASLHCRSDSPTIAAQESGTMGDKAKPSAAYHRRLCCLCVANAPLSDSHHNLHRRLGVSLSLAEE